MGEIGRGGRYRERRGRERGGEGEMGEIERGGRYREKRAREW